jgi:hypothetical protein
MRHSKIDRLLERLSFSTLFMASILFMMACTDYGQLGCDGKCNHPYDGKPGSCATGNVSVGQIGGSCAGWPSPACAAGGTCIDGTCLPCGGDGELCCGHYSPNPSECTDGTCAATADYPTCDSSCGTLTPGQDTCCPGNGTKCSEGACDVDTNKCIQPQSVPCTGANPYAVALVDGAGCVLGTFYFSGDNDTDAKACADGLKAMYGAADECTLGQIPTEKDVCESSFLGTYSAVIGVCDPAKLAACEQEQCSNCTFQDGSCP